MRVQALKITRNAALAAFALCAQLSTASYAVETDKFSDTSRIVSVGGSLTEIVYALGAGDMLVARDQTSSYPPEAAKLADVGYMRQLSAEGVLSVNPSGILLLESSGPPETLDVLKKASVPMVVIPEKHTAENIIEKINLVGVALGREAEAKQLAEKVQQDLKAVEKITAGQDPRKRVMFILSAQDGRINASGTGTGANGVIELAGAENALNEYQGYKQLTDEAIEKAAPDAILIMDVGADTVTDEELFRNAALAATPAGRSKNVIRMDSLYLLGFGPRTGAAIREVSERLYGNQSEQ